MILSIDVGIRNLSYCLIDEENVSIISWSVIDLTGDSENVCTTIDKNGLCGSKAVFKKSENCFCLKHAKKSIYIQPNKELGQSNLKKMSVSKLIELADKYNIAYDSPVKKVNILSSILNYINEQCLVQIKKTSAKTLDLVTIGKNIQQNFSYLLHEYEVDIDTIIIENQIGPIANKMKTIQGQIAQYFIMKNNNINIEFVNASNKLKNFITEKTDYKQRKKLSIEITKKIIQNDQRFSIWIDKFNNSNKKDDLADCFLQGLWYINYKEI